MSIFANTANFENKSMTVVEIYYLFNVGRELRNGLKFTPKCDLKIYATTILIFNWGDIYTLVKISFSRKSSKKVSGAYVAHNSWANIA